MTSINYFNEIGESKANWDTLINFLKFLKYLQAFLIFILWCKLMTFFIVSKKMGVIIKIIGNLYIYILNYKFFRINDKRNYLLFNIISYCNYSFWVSNVFFICLLKHWTLKFICCFYYTIQYMLRNIWISSYLYNVWIVLIKYNNNNFFNNNQYYFNEFINCYFIKYLLNYYWSRKWIIFYNYLWRIWF